MTQFLIEKEKKNRQKGNKKKFLVCFYCKKEYRIEDREKAEEHLKKHDLVLVPIALNDLSRLVQFFYLKEDSLLSPHLIKLLKQYAQQAIRSGK